MLHPVPTFQPLVRGHRAIIQFSNGPQREHYRGASSITCRENSQYQCRPQNDPVQSIGPLTQRRSPKKVKPTMRLFDGETLDSCAAADTCPASRYKNHEPVQKLLTRVSKGTGYLDTGSSTQGTVITFSCITKHSA